MRGEEARIHTYIPALKGTIQGDVIGEPVGRGICHSATGREQELETTNQGNAASEIEAAAVLSIIGVGGLVENLPTQVKAVGKRVLQENA